LKEINENPKDKHEKKVLESHQNPERKITPRYIQMRDRTGRLVSLTKRAEAIADDLEREHWNNPTENGNKRQIDKNTYLRANEHRIHQVK
jgi:hypothetical protein